MLQQISSTQSCYPYAVDAIRDREYPTLKDVTYLDHAGTTPYAKSLIDKYSQVLAGNLFGNPHSGSAASQRTSSRVEDIRLKALRFFNADPDAYDLVFVSNTTAGMKLIAESLRDFHSSASDCRGFWYGYHADSHTSLVGIRALADHGTQCYTTDVEVEKWISNLTPEDQEPRLFAYPAQSNLNGRRFPLKWCNEIRQAGGRNTFTLLDAASLVSTSPLNLSDSQVSPDFVVLSFYKIFGFPDLGALIVRKESGHIFSHRRYFGGGTVDAVTVDDDYCMRKQSSIHDQLEDGTLPFHNIIALESALEVHKSLYGSMANISHHTAVLTEELYNRLSSIAHANGRPVCRFYQSPGCSYTDRHTQGPIIALNLLDSNGECIGKSEVEKLASVKAIHIRGGTLCNPGGTASLLNLSCEEIQANYNAGQRCGDDNDIMQGKPTGALRLSLGAMTTSKDVDRFVAFIKEFYAEQSPPTLQGLNLRSPVKSNRYYVESLCVYPIKSCSGFTIPPGMPWKVRAEGLAWDREWGIVHEGTGVVLSQKRYPRMALIKPAFEFEKGVLRIAVDSSSGIRRLEIPLCGDDKTHVHEMENTKVCQKHCYATKSSSVCGDRVSIHVYSSPEVASFFSEVLGVPCTLARFPATSAARHAKDLSSRQQSHKKRQEMPGSFPLDNSQMREPKNELHGGTTSTRNRIFFSNESPILLVTRSSVNRLNEQIKENSKNVTTVVSTSNKAVPASVFRANIVVAENLPSRAHFSSPATMSSSRFEQPYIEDTWSSIQIGREKIQFDVLGSCQRCQMVCIDQLTAERRDEPLSTLAKTRRIGGKVMFGRHLCLSSTANLDLDNEEIDSIQEQERTIMVGDLVMPT